MEEVEEEIEYTPEFGTGVDEPSVLESLKILEGGEEEELLKSAEEEMEQFKKEEIGKVETEEEIFAKQLEEEIEEEEKYVSEELEEAEKEASGEYPELKIEEGSTLQEKVMTLTEEEKKKRKTPEQIQRALTKKGRFTLAGIKRKETLKKEVKARVVEEKKKIIKARKEVQEKIDQIKSTKRTNQFKLIQQQIVLSQIVSQKEIITPQVSTLDTTESFYQLASSEVSPLKDADFKRKEVLFVTPQKVLEWFKTDEELSSLRVTREELNQLLTREIEGKRVSIPLITPEEAEKSQKLGKSISGLSQSGFHLKLLRLLATKFNEQDMKDEQFQGKLINFVNNKLDAFVREKLPDIKFGEKFDISEAWMIIKKERPESYFVGFKERVAKPPSIKKEQVTLNDGTIITIGDTIFFPIESEFVTGLVLVSDSQKIILGFTTGKTLEVDKKFIDEKSIHTKMPPRFITTIKKGEFILGKNRINIPPSPPDIQIKQRMYVTFKIQSGKENFIMYGNVLSFSKDPIKVRIIDIVGKIHYLNPQVILGKSIRREIRERVEEKPEKITISSLKKGKPTRRILHVAALWLSDIYSSVMGSKTELTCYSNQTFSDFYKEQFKSWFYLQTYEKLRKRVPDVIIQKAQDYFNSKTPQIYLQSFYSNIWKYTRNPDLSLLNVFKILEEYTTLTSFEVFVLSNLKKESLKKVIVRYKLPQESQVDSLSIIEQDYLTDVKRCSKDKMESVCIEEEEEKKIVKKETKRRKKKRESWATLFLREQYEYDLEVARKIIAGEISDLNLPKEYVQELKKAREEGKEIRLPKPLEYTKEVSEKKEKVESIVEEVIPPLPVVITSVVNIPEEFKPNPDQQQEYYENTRKVLGFLGRGHEREEEKEYLVMSESDIANVSTEEEIKRLESVFGTLEDAISFLENQGIKVLDGSLLDVKNKLMKKDVYIGLNLNEKKLLRQLQNLTNDGSIDFNVEIKSIDQLQDIIKKYNLEELGKKYKITSIFSLVGKKYKATPIFSLTELPQEKLKEINKTVKFLLYTHFVELNNDFLSKIKGDEIKKKIQEIGGYNDIDVEEIIEEIPKMILVPFSVIILELRRLKNFDLITELVETVVPSEEKNLNEIKGDEAKKYIFELAERFKEEVENLPETIEKFKTAWILEEFKKLFKKEGKDHYEEFNKYKTKDEWEDLYQRTKCVKIKKGSDISSSIVSQYTTKMLEMNEDLNLEDFLKVLVIPFLFLDTFEKPEGFTLKIKPYERGYSDFFTKKIKSGEYKLVSYVRKIQNLELLDDYILTECFPEFFLNIIEIQKKIEVDVVYKSDYNDVLNNLEQRRDFFVNSILNTFLFTLYAKKEDLTYSDTFKWKFFTKPVIEICKTQTQSGFIQAVDSKGFPLTKKEEIIKGDKRLIINVPVLKPIEIEDVIIRKSEKGYECHSKQVLIKRFAMNNFINPYSAEVLDDNFVQLISERYKYELSLQKEKGYATILENIEPVEKEEISEEDYLEYINEVNITGLEQLETLKKFNEKIVLLVGEDEDYLKVWKELSEDPKFLEFEFLKAESEVKLGSPFDKQTSPYFAYITEKRVIFFKDADKLVKTLKE